MIQSILPIKEKYSYLGKADFEKDCPIGGREQDWKMQKQWKKVCKGEATTNRKDKSLVSFFTSNATVAFVSSFVWWLTPF